MTAHNTIVLMNIALKHITQAKDAMKLVNIDIDELYAAEKHLERILKDIEMHADEAANKYRGLRVQHEN